jgi:hypothetical protein
MSTATLQVESLHRLASDLRVPVSRVIRAIDKLGLKPALQIDSTAYYSAEQAEAIAAHLQPKANRE